MAMVQLPELCHSISARRLTAFDLIDHNILATKLSTYNIPETSKYWILDFLNNRKQRVKLDMPVRME